MILVSNNAYTLDLLSLGERKRLDEGRLHLYAATGIMRSRWTERSGTQFAINASAGYLRAAVDGEPSGSRRRSTSASSRDRYACSFRRAFRTSAMWNASSCGGGNSAGRAQRSSATSSLGSPSPPLADAAK